MSSECTEKETDQIMTLHQNEYGEFLVQECTINAELLVVRIMKKSW